MYLIVRDKTTLFGFIRWIEICQTTTLPEWELHTHIFRVWYGEKFEELQEDGSWQQVQIPSELTTR